MRSNRYVVDGAYIYVFISFFSIKTKQNKNKAAKTSMCKGFQGFSNDERVSSLLRIYNRLFLL